MTIFAVANATLRTKCLISKTLHQHCFLRVALNRTFKQILWKHQFQHWQKKFQQFMSCYSTLQFIFLKMAKNISLKQKTSAIFRNNFSFGKNLMVSSTAKMDRQSGKATFIVKCWLYNKRRFSRFRLHFDGRSYHQTFQKRKLWY